MSDWTKGWLARLGTLDPERRRDLRIALLLGLLGVALYLPGIGWGFPEADERGKTLSWAADELGPIGPIVDPFNTFTHGSLGNPAYPLFHYVLLLLFYAPYLALEWLTGGLVHPHAGYPFGFVNPARGVQSLLFIARGVSVLMGAGTGVAAYFTAKQLWNRAAGVMAGVTVLLIYPMFYYARTSNVDVPALFWMSLVLLLFARSLCEPLTGWRAGAMGVFAALAMATKDQSYGLLALLPAALLPMHLRFLAARGEGSVWRIAKAPAVGLAAFLGVYALASGLVVYPAKYLHHLDFIRHGAGHYRFYFEYPDTLAGYWGLTHECFLHVEEMLGWPIFLAAVAGVILCAVRETRTLTLLLPVAGLFLLVLVPVRYVTMRFLIPWGFLMACFAAGAVSIGLASGRRAVRLTCIVAVLVGWGFSLVHAADLTYVMWNDSRDVATQWLAAQTRPGDRVEYFPGPRARVSSRVTILPRMPVGVRLVPSEVQFDRGQGSLQAEFVITEGPGDQESHDMCPRWVYDGLRSGALGYDLATVIQTRSWFAHLEISPLNPRIEIFVRRDRAPGAVK